MPLHISTKPHSYAGAYSGYHNRANGDSFAAPLYGHTFVLVPEDGFINRKYTSEEYAYSRHPKIAKPYATTYAQNILSPEAVKHRYNCLAKSEERDAIHYHERAHANCLMKKRLEKEPQDSVLHLQSLLRPNY